MQKYKGSKADLVLIDFPWNIQAQTKSGSKFLPYDTLTIADLYNIDMNSIQSSGFVLFWVVNYYFVEGLEFFRRNGYR